MISRLILHDQNEVKYDTQATGERLKAGNIKVRVNQKRVAKSFRVSEGQRSDTRVIKKSLAVVSFRHDTRS